MRFSDKPIRWESGHAFISVEHDGKIVDTLEVPIRAVHVLARIGLLRTFNGALWNLLFAYVHRHRDAWDSDALGYVGLTSTLRRLLQSYYNYRRKNPDDWD